MIESQVWRMALPSKLEHPEKYHTDITIRLGPDGKTVKMYRFVLRQRSWFFREYIPMEAALNRSNATSELNLGKL